ncbi:KilA-N domain-containing protein [Salmonella enterica subsp. enterica]|nr:KilA-N domain-containing protein [Salmonella enterica subsp. enterica]
MDIKAIIVNKEVVDIRLDSEGRANMNDVHKASGGKPNKRPGSFLRGRKAMKLNEDLSTAQKRAVVTYEGGDYESGVTGTYCHIDILLAYAAWIDADFYITVAKTFGNVARGDVEAAQAVAFGSSIQKREKRTMKDLYDMP